MNLVDSSGWLAYFSDGKNAEIFSEPLNEKINLIVPTVVFFEVFKVVLREQDENAALQIAATMQQGKLVDLTPEISMRAAKLSLQYKTPMADSIILATGQSYKAIIWTQDIHFKDIPGTRYFKK